MRISWMPVSIKLIETSTMLMYGRGLRSLHLLIRRLPLRRLPQLEKS